MCMGNSNKSAAAAERNATIRDEEARAQAARLEAEAKAAEDERRATIESGREAVNGAFAGFDDNWFASREGAFMQNAKPQLDRQFGDARDQLIYSLADAGTLRSSTAASRLADLERDYGSRRIELADEARNESNRVRTDVDSTRSDIIRSLMATGDSAGSQDIARASSRTLANPVSFEPLAQVFQNVGAGIGVARNARDAEAVRNGTYGQGTRLFGTGTTGSSKLVT